MEQLKQYLRDNIIFDEHDDVNGDNFKSVLFDELDRIGIYAADNREFFNIDPEAVIHYLAFNFMYSELYNNYMSNLEDLKK